MTIQQLEAYVTVCETNSFSKAAKQLNMYPSNLSYTITEFETSLDAILLNRSKKGVYPNRIGREVYRQAKDILELVSNCTENLDTIRQSGKSLSIAYSRQFSLAGFQQRLRELDAAFEANGIFLHLIIPNDENMVFKSLHNRNADIAIVYEEGLEADSNCRKIFLETDPAFIALSRQHPLANKTALTLDAIKEETILLCSDGNLWDIYAQNLFYRSNISPHGFASCCNYLVQRELLIQHPRYLSIVSSLSVHPDDPDICCIPLAHPAGHRKIYIAYPPNEEKQALITEAIETLTGLSPS